MRMVLTLAIASFLIGCGNNRNSESHAKGDVVAVKGTGGRDLTLTSEKSGTISSVNDIVHLTPNRSIVIEGTAGALYESGDYIFVEMQIKTVDGKWSTVANSKVKITPASSSGSETRFQAELKTPELSERDARLIVLRQRGSEGSREEVAQANVHIDSAAAKL